MSSSVFKTISTGQRNDLTGLQFSSAIECDLYFKSSTNRYLSFLVKELITKIEYKNNALLNCIDNDEVLGSFFDPYFNDVHSIDFSQEDQGWFMNTISRMRTSKNAMQYLLEYPFGSFDTALLRLSPHKMFSENFQKAVKGLKQVSHSLIVIEDVRYKHLIKETDWIKIQKAEIVQYFTRIHEIKSPQWNFAVYTNNDL